MGSNLPVAGTAYFKINGRQHKLRGNLKVSPFFTEREGIAGADGVHGFKETFRVPWIEGDITDSGDLKLKDIQAIRDATITAELVNGKTYLLRNAWCQNALELDPLEGQFTVKFEGMDGDELTAGGGAGNNV